MMKKTILTTLLAAAFALNINAAELPFEEKFTSSIGEFTIYNGNDGDQLKFYNQYQGVDNDPCIYFAGSNTTLGADSWLISPAFDLKEGLSYELNYQYKIYNYGSEYTMEWVLLSDNTTAPSGKTIETVNDTYTYYSWKSSTIFVTPETSGTYYIGMHLTSKPNQGSFYLDNISIATGVNSKSPKTPTATYPTFSTEGENLIVKFDITAPTQYISGNDLPQDGLKLKVTRSDNESILFTQDVKPGEVWNFSDPAGAEKSVQYYVSAIINDIEGDKTQVNWNPSFAKPKAVSNLNVNREDDTFTLTWDAVNEGATNGIFFPSKVTYTVKCGRETIQENLTGTTFKYDYPVEDITEGQVAINFTVIAVNSAGESAATTSANYIVGKPYTKEYRESFANRQFKTTPWVAELNSSNWDTAIEVYSPAVKPQDNDGGLLTTNNNSYAARILSPIINMAGETNPLLKFFMWHQKDYYYDTSVTVGFRSNGTDTEGIQFMTKTSELESGWYEKTIEIPAEVLAGDFQIYFYTPGGDYGKVCIDNISILSYPDYSIALTALQAPEAAEIGHKIELTAQLENKGLNPISDYTVSFYADDELLGTIEGEELAAQTSGSESHTFTVLPKYAGKTVALKAVVSTEKDENEDDNEAVAELTVNENTLSTPLSLSAAVTENNVTLTWEAPEVSDEPTVEDVTEDFETWDFGVKEGQDGWIFVDVDGQEKYLFGEWGKNEFYGARTTGKYVPSYGTAFTPHSGDVAVIFGKAYSYQTPEIESWIISPEVAPGSDVSFFATGYYGYSTYTDSFSLLYSEGGTEPDDFTELKTFSATSGVWSECTATLPATAKRFAIRFKGEMRNYNLAFDDITYSSYSAAAEHKGYNVYRNHELIAAIPSVETTSYTDSELESGVHNHYVTAVYDKGESMPSSITEARIGATGISKNEIGGMIKTEPGRIIIDGAEGKFVVVSDISGRKISSREGNIILDVTGGIYVISIDGVTVKILVK